MNLQRKVISAALAIFAIPLAEAAIPLVTPASASAGWPDVSLTITPVTPVNTDTAPRISFTVPKYQLSDSEREIVAACLVLEAASQGEFGMRGVMAVIRNRARHLPELFAPTVLRPKQFSALNRLTAGRESTWRVLMRAKKDRMWPVALQLVDDATTDDWHDPTGGATHYTRVGERTPWTRALARTVTIGRHAFYR